MDWRTTMMCVFVTCLAGALFYKSQPRDGILNFVVKKSGPITRLRPAYGSVITIMFVTASITAFVAIFIWLC